MPLLLVSESPFPRNRFKVLVDEYRHVAEPLATLKPERDWRLAATETSCGD
jgi:hypothetical protein